MAESPSHRFGQIIGEMLEEIIHPVLKDFCDKRGLYLDRKGERTARNGRKLKWEDGFGNSHDLDFVIEKGGTDQALGRPLAFIETAWRRYTKHSKNKAQEIQGALLPIAEKYLWDKPFLGVVLAGVFTKPSLEQMRSSGFQTVLFPYESIVAAFRSIGIDTQFDESTEDKTFKTAVDAIERLRQCQEPAWSSCKAMLVATNQALIDSFFRELAMVLDRTIDRVLVLPLYGTENNFVSIDDAVQFIQAFQESAGGGAFRKYELIVHYTNGDRIDASFSTKREALRFLDYVGT